MRYRMGIDIGGTFTDVVLEDLRQGTIQLGKLLTTPEDPAAAVIDATKQILAKAGAAAADVLVVIHGTTLATNAVIERKGATTGLLTTDGFIDVLAIGRESRYDHYDLQLEPPEPLVPRSRRCGVVERIDRDGAVVRSIDPRQLSAQVDNLRKAGVASIAVCYLHSFKNPAHERATANHIAMVAPDILVSSSSDVSPELREYERTSTTVINAYLQPIMERYLERLENELKQLGIAGTLHLMLSSGLLTTAAQARRFPTRLIESGPAGGVKLATHYAKLTGQKNLIAFDMGGTTAKASVIHEGEVPVAREFEVARVERFKRGSGFPVRVPCVEIVEIGTGGGSIAWIDELGQLQVGPRSAGSVPGAACYDRGGTNATVTDADLVLGYLDPNYFLGGEMRLDVDAAVQAIESKVAMPLGIPVAQAAWGIHRVANEEMASAFRIHAMEQGRDPSRYGLLCFGGAGPVHAFGVAHILRSPSIISPALAGVASALGFLVAPVAAETVRSYVARLDRIDWDYLNTILDELADEGRGFLREAGIEEEAMRVVRSADMQYVGQMHDIAVNVPSGRLRPADEDGLRQAFYVRYRELFQRVVTRVPVEALTWRVTVSAPAPEIDLRWRPTAPAVNARKGERPAYFPERGFLTTPIFDRYALRPGEILRGPAIVEERESTLVVGSDAQIRVDSYGSLVVDMPANQSAEAA